jgi:hypothetical protein
MGLIFLKRELESEREMLGESFLEGERERERDGKEIDRERERER